MFKSYPGILPATLHPPAILSPLPPGRGGDEYGHPFWPPDMGRVVKGKPPPPVPTGPSPPAARLIQLYRDCVARGTWARLCFETTGGEEELSFSCRVGGAATGASKKQGRPANERRKERARRRRAWEERRRRPARKEQQLPQQQRDPPARQEKQSPAGAAAIGAAAVSRSSSRR